MIWAGCNSCLSGVIRCVSIFSRLARSLALLVVVSLTHAVTTAPFFQINLSAVANKKRKKRKETRRQRILAVFRCSPVGQHARPAAISRCVDRLMLHCRVFTLSNRWKLLLSNSFFSSFIPISTWKIESEASPFAPVCIVTIDFVRSFVLTMIGSSPLSFP